MRQEAEERAADELAIKAAAVKAAAAVGDSLGDADDGGDNSGGVVVVMADGGSGDAAASRSRTSGGAGGTSTTATAASEDPNPDAVHFTHQGFVQLTPYQAQLICVARVVLREPKVYLFDAVTRHVRVPELRQRLQAVMDKVSELDSTIMVTDEVS